MHSTYICTNVTSKVYDHYQVKHKRAELLKHPLVVRLLEYKWRKVALPLFLGYISVYLLFVLMLTLFALLSPRPSPDNDTCE